MLSSSVASSSSAAAALDLVRLSALTFSSSCSIPSCQTLYGPGRRDLDQVGVRRDTFIFWPSWAPTSVVPREMAEVGLYYTGDADEVRCHECSICIRDWKEGDDPRTVHLSKSPMCPFLNRHIATESRVSSTNTTTVTKQSVDVDRRSIFDSESWDDEDDTDGANRTRYSISDSLSSDAMDVFKPQTQSHSLRNHKCDVAPKIQTAKYSDDYFNPDNPNMRKESVKMCSNNETKKHCLTASSTKLIGKYFQLL